MEIDKNEKRILARKFKDVIFGVKIQRIEIKILARKFKDKCFDVIKQLLRQKCSTLKNHVDHSEQSVKIP